ncbi:hypothetical protein NKI89_01875 [Mesorhizobium sp. M0309]|uniref:helix-turn-helix domain-containing protein n=1 Tax=Mesorhizobium sp. M0309 TaxID=2956933 RepID=UPI003335135A
MAKRRQNPRLAKSLHCYTIIEVADLYGVHRNTVRHWLANGLQALDAKRPVMVHGTALNRFHMARRDMVAQTCGPGEVYCLGCRRPRKPAGLIADFTPLTEKVGTLSAICPVCEGMMTQRVNSARLQDFAAEVEVSARPAPEAIKESC